MKYIIRHITLALLVLVVALNSMAQVNWGNHNALSPEPNTMSSALGDKNHLIGLFSTAIGYNNQTEDKSTNSTEVNFSFATGVNNKVIGHHSFAFGTGNEINDQKSMAFGFSNKILKNSSFAIGLYNTIEKGVSIAIGYNIKNTTKFGITIGYGYDSYSKTLQNDTDGIMMGMNSNKPTLFVSKSDGANKTGKVGIGDVTSPQAKLHIKADSGEKAELMLEASSTSAIYFKDTKHKITVDNEGKMSLTAERFDFNNGGVYAGNIYAGNVAIGKNITTLNPEISFNGNSNKISVGSDNIMNFTAQAFNFNTGKVGIGCENNVEGFALAVKGGVVSTQMSVMAVDAWPDFVFSGDYKRMSLYELEEYIDRNHHLPEIPSAEEVSANGIDLGEMNALLLQKVEELTLHVIELQKQIDELKSR